MYIGTSGYISIKYFSESEFLGFLIAKVKLSGLTMAESTVSNVTLKLINSAIGKILKVLLLRRMELQRLKTVLLPCSRSCSILLADVFGIFDSFVSV